ncbi:MAG: hypothetical protein LBQ57_07655 [Spirochaetales bacterium]|jgi:hypothetical protein|nr:hypothetical protein [Spirochaetales bacterium]
MASIFFKYYTAVENASDAAVKKQYGVSKANALKVLEALLVADISDSGKKAPAAAKKTRGRKPGRKPGKVAAKKPGKPGRKPGRKPAKKTVRPVKALAPRIEVS